MRIHTWMGAVVGILPAFLLFLLSGRLDHEIQTNLLALQVNQCLNAPRDRTACQSAADHLAALKDSGGYSLMIRQSYAALGDYTQAVEGWPPDRRTSNPIAAYWLGVAFENLGQYEVTAGLWQEAHLPSQVPLSFIEAAHLAHDSSRVEQLVMLATRLTPLRNSDTLPYPDIDEYSRALIRWRYPRLAAALQQWLADHEPEDKIHHWYAVAEAARLRNDWTAAIQALNTARETWPDDELLRVRLIQAYIGTKEPSKSQEIAEDWLAKEADNPTALFWGAQAAFQTRDFAKVRNWCERFILTDAEEGQIRLCEKWLSAVP